MPPDVSKGRTSIRNVRELVELANREKKTLVINVGRGPSAGVVVVATGKRAALLRRLCEVYNEL
jgi:hypothetical protein